MKDKWYKRFMQRAKQVAYWSKDPEHKVGAIIVDKYNHVLGEGFNGPPRGLRDNASKDIRRYQSLHAELNAILFSRGDLRGSTMFVYPYSPCSQCAAVIIQVGIGEVIYYVDANLGTWNESQMIAFDMLKEAGIHIRCDSDS